MRRALRFWKLTAAGNDFVLVDSGARDPRGLARRLCDRREGVGADGMLSNSQVWLASVNSSRTVSVGAPACLSAMGWPEVSSNPTATGM